MANQTTAVNAKVMMNCLKVAIKNKHCVLITGKPGLGKSAIVKQVADELGYDLIVFHPVVTNPTDVKGFPVYNQNKDVAKWVPFGKLQKLVETEKPTICFIDDLRHATQTVQAAFMQLVHERSLNGVTISDNVTFVSATNFDNDRAGGHSIISPLLSRFTWVVELVADAKVWVEWAMANEIDYRVIAYINFRPDSLHVPPAIDNMSAKGMENYPNPRTLHHVSDVLRAGYPDEVLYDLIEGAAGKGFATEFYGYIEVIDKLPDLDDIIVHPENFDVKAHEKNPGELYAISAGLAAKATKENFANVAKIADQLPKEFGVMTMLAATRRDKSLIAVQGVFSKWVVNNSEVF